MAKQAQGHQMPPRRQGLASGCLQSQLVLRSLGARVRWQVRSQTSQTLTTVWGWGGGAAPLGGGGTEVPGHRGERKRCKLLSWQTCVHRAETQKDLCPAVVASVQVLSPSCSSLLYQPLMLEKMHIHHLLWLEILSPSKTF